MKREVVFNTEAELCAAFIDWATKNGYVCYPETEGWDILLVDADGMQIGVEAKLRLNLKVISQALPSYNCDIGPDHRAVLVPEPAGDLRGLMRFIGVECFYCTTRSRHWVGNERPHHFVRDDMLSSNAMFDWNPKRRCSIPEYMPDVPAGVPSPLQLSPWKVGALKVLAHIEIHGDITREQIGRYGIDARRWTSGDGWLTPVGGTPRRGGRWAAGTAPRFDQQHPVVYAQILSELRSAPAPAGQQELVA